MKIKEILYTTPEMSEEKLLKIMESHLNWIPQYIKDRVWSLHKEESTLSEAFLKEYDIIQDKKSYLTKSQRNAVVGFVTTCMIEMTKNNGTSGK